MRLFPVIAAVLMLAGCMSVPVVPSSPSDWSAANERCQEATKDYEVSGLRKTMIYASNVVVLPVTTALTLGLAGVFVSPMSDVQARQYLREQCMTKLGYGNK